ncbi:hypothetical protein ALC53_10780 [Atta colombica]|uniref:Uncharacterized protein n=1 Tax=Atta colombica TaxID=520822 RepID=A0A195B2M1_9HYME|nr:hypothetical protein ALC53_10780 [Atta colombica]
MVESVAYTDNGPMLPKDFSQRFIRQSSSSASSPPKLPLFLRKVHVIHHTALGYIATLVHPHEDAHGRAPAHQRLRTKPAANDSSNFRKLLWDARLRHSLQAMAMRVALSSSIAQRRANPILPAHQNEVHSFDSTLGENRNRRQIMTKISWDLVGAASHQLTCSTDI